MKKGENPQRGKMHNSITPMRVFVVVYVPNLAGFFSNMKTILGLCLDSLEHTVNPAFGRVTIISNASCSEVEKLLLERQSNLFDQIIINRDNRGKIDGLLAAARGALEEVVVLSDCDVLFQHGWLEEILQVFANFPEAASVSPITSPRRYFYETRTTLLDAAVKRELGIKKRMPAEDFARMTEGSDNPDMQLRFLQGQVTVSRNGYDTGVAGGHQCVAFRRDIMQRLPFAPCQSLLEPHADRDYLDSPPDFYGYWRLSTPRNYAFHMGNTPSEWMYESANEMVAKKSLSPSQSVNKFLPLPSLRKPVIGRLPYLLRRKLSYPIHLMLARRLGSFI